MRKVAIYILWLAAAFATACNKDKDLVAQLESQKAEAESVVKHIPDATEPVASEFRVQFDKEYLWVDAAGTRSFGFCTLIGSSTS